MYSDRDLERLMWTQTHVYIVLTELDPGFSGGHRGVVGPQCWFICCHSWFVEVVHTVAVPGFKYGGSGGVALKTRQ